MTVKAGQKCTAIRRAIVPRQHLDAVGRAPARAAREDRRRRSRRSKACAWARSPRRRSSATSPSASAMLAQRQRDRVRRRATASRRVGDGVADGAFFAPTLLLCRNAHGQRRGARRRGLRPGQHADALRRPSTKRSRWPRAARAAWSRRWSRRTRRSPRTRCRSRPRGTAACSCSTARRRPSRPATARRCRMLKHGGPGRAGGGEELGGIRAVKHYLQRAAVQGSPTMLAAVTGEYVRGAARARKRRPSVPQALRGPARSATRC